MPQFVRPNEPFHTKQTVPIHTSFFTQGIVAGLGASNNIISHIRVKLKSLDKKEREEKGDRVEDLKGKENVVFKRSYDKRARVMSNDNGSDKKPESKFYSRGEKKNWLRIDTLGLG